MPCWPPLSCSRRAPRPGRRPLRKPSRPPPPPPPEDAEAETPPKPEDSTADPPETVLRDAALAALPAGLLASLKQRLNRARLRQSGRFGARERNTPRGRAMGAKPGDPRTGARLGIVDTLRAAAPWQKLRRVPALAMARLPFAVRISALSAAARVGAPRRSSWWMPLAPQRCNAWVKPRARCRCCWPNAMSAGTRWR